MNLTIKAAKTSLEIEMCRQLVAQVYGRAYGVRFVDGMYDLENKIEAWPDRHIMAQVDGQIVGTFGLHEIQTYVERFGQVGADDVEEILIQAGIDADTKRPLCETAKLAVDPSFRGMGIASLLVAAIHSRDFLNVLGDPLVLVCSKPSLFHSVWGSLPITTRHIKPFPRYRVHERYSSAEDPLESRLIIPDLDVPSRWRNLVFPAKFLIHETKEYRETRMLQAV